MFRFYPMPRSTALRVALAGVSLLALGASARGAEPEAPSPTQAALREEMRDVLSRMVASGVIKLDANAAVEVEAPPDRVLSLGLVLDTAPGRGPQVLAVTPGGNAAAIGLRTGDRLLAINGRSVVGGSAESVRNQALAAAGAAPTQFEIERAGKALTLSGVLRPIELPGFRLQVGTRTGVAAASALAAAIPAAAADDGACGRISHFAVAPRSEKLYPAKIIAIDGHIPGPSSAASYRVHAGSHEVTLAEDIDYEQLPMVYSRLRRQYSEKTFSVDVAPDTTVLVAAKLVPPGERGEGDYWQAVAWKSVPEACR